MDEAQIYDARRSHLDRLVAKFCRKNGLSDYEGVRADANLYFVQHLRRHDPDKMPLADWLSIKVYNSLAEDVRKQVRRDRNIRKREGFDLDGLEQRRTNFDLEAFLSELDKKTREVVELILAPPRELREAVDQKEDKSAVWKMAVRELLKDLGWSLIETRALFTEVRKALRCYHQ